MGARGKTRGGSVMKRFYLEKAGVSHLVRGEPTPGSEETGSEESYSVVIEDRTYVVGVERASSRTVVQLQQEDGTPRRFEVRATRESADAFAVSCGGFEGKVQVRSALAMLAGDAALDGGAKGGQRVSAYMPGRVVSMLLGVGDAVEPGQGVLVLEAMKMENEIQAEMAGVVSRIHVEVGQPVEAGDLLFEIAPD